MTPVEACTENLRQIYHAMVHFQKLTRGLPRWLSDLYPESLKDRQVLICPNAKNETQLPGSDPRLPCRYAYQLQPVRLKDKPDKTQRQWKIEQLQQFGPFVPIVRCWHHLEDLEGKVLNLSYAGHTYTSSAAWEDEISQIQTQVATMARPDFALGTPFLWRVARVFGNLPLPGTRGDRQSQSD